MMSQTGRHSREVTQLNDEQMIEFKTRLKNDVLLLGEVCSRYATDLFTRKHYIGDNEVVRIMDNYRPNNLAGFAAAVATKAAITASLITEGIALEGAEWPQGMMLPDELYGHLTAIDQERGRTSG